MGRETAATGFPCVHILPQQCWHDPAFIVGNREGLTALRDAINDALIHESASTEVFADDGEGYRVAVVYRHDMSDVPFGYTDEITGRRRLPRWLLAIKNG